MREAERIIGCTPADAHYMDTAVGYADECNGELSPNKTAQSSIEARPCIIVIIIIVILATSSLPTVLISSLYCLSLAHY